MLKSLKAFGKCTGVSVRKFYIRCNEERKRILDESIFGHLFRISEKLVFIGDLIDTILSFWVQENVFKVKNTKVMLQESDIALILGLNMLTKLPVSPESEPVPVPEQETIRYKFFRGQPAKRALIEEIIDSGQLSDDEFLKLSLLFLVCSFLLPNTYQEVDSEHLDLIDNLEKFNEFPWGLTVYKNLVECISKAILRRETAKISSKGQYNIYGCTIALQIWALEHFPGVAPPRTPLKNPFPRMMKWEAPKFSRTPNFFRDKFLKSSVIVELDVEKHELQYRSVHLFFVEREITRDREKENPTEEMINEDEVSDYGTRPQQRAQEVHDDDDDDGDNEDDDGEDNNDDEVVIRQQPESKGKQPASRQQPTKEQPVRQSQLIAEVIELRKECISLRIAVREMKGNFKRAFTVLKGQAMTIEQLEREKKTLQEQVAYLTNENIAIRKDLDAAKTHLSKNPKAMANKRKLGDTDASEAVKKDGSAPQRLKRTLLGWKEKVDEKEETNSPFFRNREKVLVTCSRRIIYRYQHLMMNIVLLLPHCKKDNKVESKESKGATLNELVELRNCSFCLFFECRKQKDLYLWMAKCPNGPSVKFLVNAVHTMEELKLTGNHLKGSRPLLTFSTNFDKEPLWKLLKEMIIQIFGIPKDHRKAKPFHDHVFVFSIVDGRIWFRNYQISVPHNEMDKVDRGGLDKMTLVEVGPRFCLNPIKIFGGSFSGPTLYENPFYISPNQIRALEKKKKLGKYAKKIKAKSRRKMHELSNPLELDEFADLWKE